MPWQLAPHFVAQSTELIKANTAVEYYHKLNLKVKMNKFKLLKNGVDCSRT
jgi:hypothetical protein